MTAEMMKGRKEETTKEFQAALDAKNFNDLKRMGQKILENPFKKERKKNLAEFNNCILIYSLNQNEPDFIDFLIPQSNEEICANLSQLAKNYITHKDVRWCKAIHILSRKLVRKSLLSEFRTKFSLDLIETGVKENNHIFIDQGFRVLKTIGFRKYRADLTIKIFPLLISWGIKNQDPEILNSLLEYLNDVNDISKRSALHCDIAKAVFQVGVEISNLGHLINGIRIASSIPQKVKRCGCILSLQDHLTNSPAEGLFSDIPKTMMNFHDLSVSNQQEILRSLLIHLIKKESDYRKLQTRLNDIQTKIPFAIPCVILSLLEYAEISRNRWYYDEARSKVNTFLPSEPSILKNYIRAGLTIAEQYNEPEILENLIPFAELTKNPSRIYLQFTKSLLDMGAFYPAVTVFMRIFPCHEFSIQMADSAITLVKAAILNNDTMIINNRILMHIEYQKRDSVIHHAIIGVCKEVSFDDIISHQESLMNIIRLHSDQGSLLVEAITILIDRGFLDQNDPAILIRVTQSAVNQAERERAISNIIIKIAKTGIEKKNRDYLQRAVGLSCLIENDAVRSHALSTIIDQASRLAAEQGDLNLLQRMKDWSVSLLDKSSADFAVTNIINGMIQYSLAFQAPAALEEAYTMTGDLQNSVLKEQQVEHIAEYFVRLGCVLLSETDVTSSEESINLAIRPFFRSLELLQGIFKNQYLTLKISGFIDIIQEYATKKNRSIYLVPLSLFTLTIENPLERDAMIRRVIATMIAQAEFSDSTDPYEIMAQLLEKDVSLEPISVATTLTYKLISLISDPYSRLSNLCNLADREYREGFVNSAEILLSEVNNKMNNNSLTFEQKSIIYTEIARICSSFNNEMAFDAIDKAIKNFAYIENEKKSTVGEEIIRIMISTESLMNTENRYSHAMKIVEQIDEPLSYARSLLIISGIQQLNSTEKGRILGIIEKSANKIASPYDRAEILLDLLSHIESEPDGNHSIDVFQSINTAIKSIRVSTIADYLLNKMSLSAFRLYKKCSNPRFREIAVTAISDIEEIPLKLELLRNTQLKIRTDTTGNYEKLFSAAKKISSGIINSHQVSPIEQTLQQIQDRGKRAQYYCDMALIFRASGHTAVSDRLLNSAVNDAIIVRPLSRRAYILCDIALKCFSINDDINGKKIFDLAIEAATNIRQYSLRDEVFDDLSMGMNILQELEREQR